MKAPITSKAKVIQETRIFKGCTLDVMPITSADPGIVFNGEATIWARNRGTIGSSHWSPMKDELSAVRFFRKQVHKMEKLMAGARARAARTVTI